MNRILIGVALLRLDAATQPPDDVADLTDPLGLAPSQGPILVLVHTVFPYGEARAPCTIPFAFKALLTSPTFPPRYNTAPTRVA